MSVCVCFVEGGGRMALQSHPLRHPAHPGCHDVHRQYPQPLCHQHRQVDSSFTLQLTRRTVCVSPFLIHVVFLTCLLPQSHHRSLFSHNLSLFPKLPFRKRSQFMINNFTVIFIQKEDQNNKDDRESICYFFTLHSPLTPNLNWCKLD